MAEGTNLILVSEEPATAGAVSSALKGNGRLGSQNVCRDLKELAQRLDAGPLPAAMVDIDARPTAMLSELEPIVRRFPETRFIVLSNTLQSELVLEAMQIGARHFMVKQAIAATLVPVLHRLLGGATADGHDRYGGVVTVLSAGGGAGATTLAVNLAQELVEAKATPVMLLDMDFCYGSVGSYLGLEADHGVAELLERAGPMDSELVTTTSMQVSENLRALCSTASARLFSAGPADYGRLKNIVDASRHAARWTVVDAPRMTMEVCEELAKSSAVTLLVLQLTVKDIRTAKNMMAALVARGIAPDSIVPVVNRYHRRRMMVDLDEARRAMSASRIECLSSDFHGVSRSINYGQPLAQAAPRSAIRKEIQKIATRILDASLMRPNVGR